VIEQILKVWEQNMKSQAIKPEYTCKYCGKSFTKEATLVSHTCEQKRRALQEKEQGVQWGFGAYKLFYETTQQASKNKTYKEFCESPYYLAFVKYGRYCQSVKCINYIEFTRWLLKNNKKLDYWCSDKLYDTWLRQYIKTENVQDALERSISTMTKYAEDHEDLKNGFVDYFRYGNVNRILHHISSGYISPWVLYACKTATEFLETLDESQVALIIDWIDPAYWQAVFNKNKEDLAWARMVLKQAGL
jgi:hypothetical protein